MAACVGKLNKSIFRGGMEDDDMDIDEGGEDRVWLARRHPAIRGIASQIYNSLSHQVRNEAKFHSLQLGMIMSAFAGAGIETAGGQQGDRGWAATRPMIRKHIYGGTDTDLRRVMEREVDLRGDHMSASEGMEPPARVGTYQGQLEIVQA
ncbi:hypothetical protein EDC04DRAFT_2899856 [Pisolithus marmoratus]|nr:hypothetical protein EDC04DRAFT_2899856 [Pisolithus marmoratus]